MNKFKYSLLLCSLLSISFSPSYLDAMKRQRPEEQQSGKTSWFSKLWPFKKRKTQEAEVSLSSSLSQPITAILESDKKMNGSGTSSDPFVLKEDTDIPVLVHPEEVTVKEEFVEKDKEKEEENKGVVAISAPHIEFVDLTQILTTEDQQKYQSLIAQLPISFQKSGDVIAKILALFLEHASARLNTEISNKIEKESNSVKQDVSKDASEIKAEVVKQIDQIKKQLETSFAEAKDKAIEQNQQIADLHNNVSALRNIQKDSAASLESKLNELAEKQEELKNKQNSFGAKQNLQDSRIKKAIVVGAIAFAGTTFILYLPFIGGATFFSAVTGGAVSSMTGIGGTWIVYSIMDVIDSMRNVKNKLNECVIL